MADHDQDEYKNVKFYAKHSKPKQAGFSKFDIDQDFYFCRYIDGDIAMLSQAYTSAAGRDNGIESVKKNEKIAKRYRFGTRGSNGHGFALKAGNGQEIAISPEYTSLAGAQRVSSRLTGSSTSASTARVAPKKPTSAKKKAAPKKKAAVKASLAGSAKRNDDYKPLAFYRNNGGSADGFNSFEKDGAYYFHYRDAGKIVLISEGYTSSRGRDNGIASVKKNMKLKTAYRHKRHRNGKYFFDLIAGNRQEVATSRWYDTESRALRGGGSLRGEKPKTRTATKTRKAAAKTGTATKARASKVTKARATKAKTARGTNVKRSGNGEQNYLPLAAYRKATRGKNKGFEQFQGEDGEYYFTYFENGKLALISEGYPSTSIRATGQASVEKNMKIEKRYVFGKGADGKDGFILRAGNHKEIARSVGYGSAAAAAAGAAYLIGTRRRVKPKAVTAAPVKTAKVKPAPKPRTVKKTAKPARKLKAGSVAVAGIGAAAAAKATPVKKAAVPVKVTKVKPAAKPKVVKKKTKPVAPLAAGAVAAAGLGAAAAAKATPVKKPAVPVKAAKPKPKPKPVVKKAKPIAPLAAGAVAIAGLGATAAAAKSKTVKKAAVPVKAPPIKVAPVKAAPIKAAPIAAAALGTAAVAAVAAKVPETPKPAPVAAVVAKPAAAAAAVKPVAAAIPAAAAAIPAATAATGGGGIWGWLKWLLLALLALFAMFALFKACAGGEKAAKVPPVATQSSTAAPAAMVSCWNGSKAKNDQACPAKITCWDNSFATRQSACPVQPVAKDFKCWDGSMTVDQAGCPAEPAKTPAATTIASPTTNLAVANTSTSNTDRFCGPSSNTLFNVRSSTPKSVGYLGSNPQFGESLSLTPAGFHRKLTTAYRTSSEDRSFLNTLATSLGYTSFDDMDASMFSNDTLSNGSSGLLGFGSQHALQYSTLNVTDASNLEAFKVRSANGTDVHFMKRCGNYMYVCQP